MPVWLILSAVGIAVAVIALSGAGSALLWVGAVVLGLGVAGLALGGGTPDRTVTTPGGPAAPRTSTARRRT